MKIMKPLFSVAGAALLMSCLLGSAAADTVSIFTGSLSSADLTQLGRLNRNGVPSDWSSSKAFPGVINATTTYHYETFTVSASLLAGGPFLQIDVDDPTTTIFASAYLNSYNPLSLTTNYLGDPGTSGNPFGNPNFFQVVTNPGDNLIIVVNEVSVGVLGNPFTITVENFSDTEFSPPVPEPSSFLLLGSGLASVVGAMRRRSLSFRFR